MDNLGNDIVYIDTEDKDIGNITLLFNIASPLHIRNVRYWKWSNCDVPFGNSVSAVAKVDGNVIAHYSVMPLDFFLGGRRTTIGFGQQAVVHPKFRNLKVIKILSDVIYERARKVFPLVYAFPNDNFFLVKKQLLGWKEVEVFNSSIAPVQNISVAKKNNIEIKELRLFPHLDWLEKESAAITIFKNTEYLNWRFVNHPVNHYIVMGAFLKTDCVGYLVLKLYLRNQDNRLIGHLIDFDTQEKDEAILSGLLFQAKQFFEFNNIEEIVFWNKETRFKSFLSKFITGQGFKTNMSVLVFDDRYTEHVLVKENWSFTMALSDAF